MTRSRQEKCHDHVDLGFVNMLFLRLLLIFTWNLGNSMQPGSDVAAPIKYHFIDEKSPSPLRKQCIDANFAAFENTHNTTYLEWYEWAWKVVDYWMKYVTSRAEEMECPDRWCVYLMGSVLELSKGKEVSEIQEMLRNFYGKFENATCPMELRKYATSNPQSIEQKIYAKYMNGYKFEKEYTGR